MCHPPFTEENHPPLHCCYQRGLSQTLGYSRCYSWSGCRAEPWAGSLSCQALLHPMAFPAGNVQGCLGTFPAPLLPRAVQAPSTSVALTTSLRAQVWRTSSKASLAVSSPPLPARCRSDGLDRLRSRAPAQKGCGHACGETLRNSAETGKTPSVPPGLSQQRGEAACPGSRAGGGPCRGPPQPAACPNLLPASLRWVGGRSGRKEASKAAECGSHGAGWWWGCSSVARWGQSFLAAPVAPDLPGRGGGVSSGSRVFAGWVFPSTSWCSHLSGWEGKALHRQRKEGRDSWFSELSCSGCCVWKGARLPPERPEPGKESLCRVQEIRHEQTASHGRWRSLCWPSPAPLHPLSLCISPCPRFVFLSPAFGQPLAEQPVVPAVSLGHCS